MMRMPIIAANWKMHKTIDEANTFLSEFLPRVANVSYAEIIISPPFLALPTVCNACRSTHISVAGQNLHWAPNGAFTGEVSAKMLSATGANHVIIGHSERRQFFGESDDVIAKKVHAAIRENLKPILCIGETLEEQESGKALDVLKRQLESGLTSLTSAELTNLTIAYEPIWAIGTGHTATPNQAQSAHAYIRECLSIRADVHVSEKCRIIYGGSVKPDNSKDILSQPDVDGALVGGASLDPKSFEKIIAGTQP